MEAPVKSSLVPVLPVKFNDWMRNIPISFISMITIHYVSSNILNVYPFASNIAVICGSFFIVAFLILYSWDFVIPKVEYWNQLDKDVRRKSLLSWFTILIFLYLFVAQGMFLSARQLVVHVLIAFMMYHLFHTDI